MTPDEKRPEGVYMIVGCLALAAIGVISLILGSVLLGIAFRLFRMISGT